MLHSFISITKLLYILYLSYFPSSPPSSVFSSSASIYPLYSLRIRPFSSTIPFLVLVIFPYPLQLLFVPPLYSHLSRPVVNLTTQSVTQMFNGRMISKWKGRGINGTDGEQTERTGNKWNGRGINGTEGNK